MPTPMVRSQFPDFGLTSAALPFLRRFIDRGRDTRPEWFQPVYRMESTDRALEQYTSIARFGQFSETDEGAAVTYDSAIQGFDQSVTPVQFALGFKISKVAFDDDKLGALKNMATDLGRSWNETRNVLAAARFNNGFTSGTGPDGVVLFSESHIHEDGVTFANKPSADADFSLTSWRAAQITFNNFTDGRGKKLALTPKTILIAPDSVHDVFELVRSPDRPDNANTAVNVYRGFFGGAPIDAMHTPYLTDVDAWFVIGDTGDSGYPLVFLEREPFTVENDVDFDTRTMKTAAWGRFQTGIVSNGVGIYGSSGA